MARDADLPPELAAERLALAEMIATGDPDEAREARRRVLALAMVDPSQSASAVAAASKELSRLEAEHEPESVEGEVSKVDELAARRARGGSAPDDSSSSARRGQPRRRSGVRRSS